jgi:predicted transcriptional regulator
MVAIPARELWLFNNKKALASVKRGIEDAAAGRVTRRGSFAKYADLELD